MSRRIPISDLIGDIAAGSEKLRPGVTYIYFTSGRYLLLADLPTDHTVHAFEPWPLVA